MTEPDLDWIPDPANALELRWRMLWGLSSIALILATVINGVVAAAIITRTPFGPAAYLPMFAAVAALVVWVVRQMGGPAERQPGHRWRRQRCGAAALLGGPRHPGQRRGRYDGAAERGGGAAGLCPGDAGTGAEPDPEDRVTRQ